MRHDGGECRTPFNARDRTDAVVKAFAIAAARMRHGVRGRFYVRKGDGVMIDMAPYLKHRKYLGDDG
jgi:hypothetical protein